MKRILTKKRIGTLMISLLFLCGCYEFDFIDQPSTTEPDSYFEVQINASSTGENSGTIYFGILLPIGWTIDNSIVYTNTSTNNIGLMVYSDSLSQRMSAIDPPPGNYFWWVGEDNISAVEGTVFMSEFKIYTDSQIGGFSLDYMLGDDYYGLNHKRSNDHSIYAGDPVGCFPGGIIFSTQEEIDSFQYNYPNCTTIAGNLIISGDSINNLNGLSVLTSVGVNLKIFNNTNLVSLTGLENIDSIGGSLHIQGNAITSMEGLGNLTHIGQELNIEYNAWLASLAELINLSFVGFNVTISGNYSLIDLTGLENLSSIAGDLAIAYNGVLVSLTGLENVSAIGGDINILSNYALTSLTGLDNVTSIEGSVSITDNEYLESLTGLENVTYIGGYLHVGKYSQYGNGNPSLTSLTGLENLTSIGGNLSLDHNALTSLSGLESLTSIGGYLSIHHSGISNLTALHNVTFIGGGLYIEYNSSLVSLTGLENVDSLSGILSLRSCNDLVSLAGLDGLVSIGGDLTISGNDDLTSLTGLESLTSIGGDLGIYTGSYSLTDLTGLESLTSLGGDLIINYNPALINLTGLESLTSIGEDIIIANNHLLSSLTGLDNVDAASINDLYIYDNPSLSDCEVQCICNYISNPSGTVNIYNNATGCNNPGEVANACGYTLDCLPYGNYYFTSQNEIDNFPANYINCTELEGDVIIRGDDIANLNGLNVITSMAGNLYVGNSDGGNPLLASLSGLEGLTSIVGDMHIQSNNALTNLTGLNNLTSVGGIISIYDNHNLTSLTGLGSLTSIGYISIYKTAIPNLTGLNNVTSINGISLNNNYALTSLTGLDNVTSMGGISLSNNDALTNLAGLNNFDTIGGIRLYANYGLKSLLGLENITFIGGDLVIMFNDSLTSLTGLDHNTFIAGDLTIGHNNTLSSCSVQSICDYLISPNGSIDIGSNAPGCDSQEEVAEACEAVSIDDLQLLEKLLISPNPSSTQIIIELPNIPQWNSILTIYNINSQKLLTQRITDQKTLVDISGLPAGLYFLNVSDERTVRVGKLVKK